MKTVVIESPYAGDNNTDIGRNIWYLRACIKDCLMRGEAPFASHGLYTQASILDDNVPEERWIGIQAGFAIGEKLDSVVVYTDRGISSGMKKGIESAKERGQDIEYRKLPSHRWGLKDKED